MPGAQASRTLTGRGSQGRGGRGRVLFCGSAPALSLWLGRRGHRRRGEAGAAALKAGAEGGMSAPDSFHYASGSEKRFDRPRRLLGEHARGHDSDRRGPRSRAEPSRSDTRDWPSLRPRPRSRARRNVIRKLRRRLRSTTSNVPGRSTSMRFRSDAAMRSKPDCPNARCRALSPAAAQSWKAGVDQARCRLPC